MKLKTLKIKNIASIEEATIPFDKAPLSTETLFLITGDTGSGKSTILNCICLALYHTTPNLEAYGSSKEKTFDDLGTDSPIQMMRRGTDNALVELTFEANNGNVYVSTWAIRKRKSRGTTQRYDTNTSLECIEINDKDTPKEIIRTKSTEIKKRIPELVGFNLDQFTRTTLLAQGQFSRFLYAKPAEKTSILEKLTGTELFAQIGIEIFNLHKAAHKQWQDLDDKINRAKPLKEEEKAELNERIATSEAESKDLDTKKNAVSEQADWLNHKELKQQTLEQKEKDLREVELVVSSEEFNQQKSVLAQWDFTHEVRNSLLTSEQQLKQSVSYAQQIQNLQQQYNQLICGLRYLEQTHQQKTEEQAKLEATLEQLRPNETMYQAAGEISRHTQNISERLQEVAKLRDEIKGLQQSIEVSKQKENALKDAVAKATEAYVAQQQITMAQRELCKDLDTKTLHEAHEQLMELENKLKNAVKEIEDYRQKLNEMDSFQQTLEGIRKEIDIYNTQLAQAQQEKPLREQTYQNAKAQFEGSLKLTEQINLIREYYSNHDECPLCGTKGVTLHSDQLLEENQLQAKQSAENAKTLLDQVIENINKLTTSLKVLNKDLKDKEAELSRKQQQYDKAKKAVEIDAQVLSFDYEDADAISKLQDRISKTAEERTAKKMEFDKAVEMQKKEDLETKRLEDASKAKEKAEKELQNQIDKTNKLQKELEIKLNGQEIAQKHASDLFQDVKSLIRLPEGIQELTYALLPSLSARISKEAQQYTAYQKQAETLAKDIEKLASEIATSKRNLEPLTTRYSMPAEVKPQEIKDLSQTINLFTNQVKTLEGKMEQAREEHKKFKDQVDKWLEEHQENYTLETLAQLQQINEAYAQNIRTKISTTENRLSAAREVHKLAQTELNKWLSQRPEIQESILMELLEANSIDLSAINANNESIENQEENIEGTPEEGITKVSNPLDLLTKEMFRKAVELFNERGQNLINVIAQAKAQLIEDEKKNQELAQDRVKRDELDKVRSNWATLAKQFGGADGKAFRDIAQSYVLRLLLQQANYYLNKLSTRYELSCEDGSLTINIIDKFQGRTIRNVNSLSGGESFVVSLALALGLSAINPQKINVDILFIDEGFGTLDKEILDTVITSLDQLHMINGRRIGLISHVDLLKERIPTQIQVTRTGASSSRITIVPEPSED